MKFLCLWISRGHFSVVFFIVLSGYSIMLPIARSGTGQLRGGVADYVRRRARRILPPYYVALGLSAMMILTYNWISRRHGLQPVVDDALSAGSFVSHLLLLHNLRFDWAFRINGPMWSVATEWQIYFIFAFALLPLFRAAGSVVTWLVAWVVFSLPFFLLPSTVNLYWAAPWFTGSFAFGMWGAVVGFAESHRDSFLRTRMPWGTLAFASFLLLAWLVGSGRADTWSLPIVDFIVSVFALSLINACAMRSAQPGAEQRSLLLRVLGSRSLVYLGGFSYSLYLIQHPVLRLAEKVVAKLTSSVDTNIQIHLLVAVPVTLFVGWLFAELFERPFTSGGIILPAIRRRFAVG